MTQPLRALTISHKPLAAVEFMPDGTLYVSGAEAIVKRWDPATGETTQSLRGHGGPVIAMDTAANARLLGTASMDGSVWIWLTEHAAKAFTLKGFHGIPAAIAFAPDASMVVTGASDRMVRVHELKAGKLMDELKGHRDEVLAVAVSPREPLIVSGGAGDPIRMWQFPSMEQIRTLEAHPIAVLALRFSADGGTLISTGADNVLRVWNADDWSQRSELSLGAEGTHALALSPTRPEAAVTVEGAALIVDLDEGKVVAEFPIPGSEVYGVSYSYDGATVATASADGLVRIWDAARAG